MASEELKHKIEFLTQFYFEDDKPIPWIEDLIIYPVLVTDYYKFHTSIECMTMDKNKDISGVGLPMSHLEYLIHRMKDPDTGKIVTNQFISMLEMTFHVKNGLFCDNPECCNYNTLDDGTHELKPREEIALMLYDDIWNNFSKITDEQKRTKFFQESSICPCCGKKKREVFTIGKNSNGKDLLYIFDTVINSKQYDELRQIVCRYNMLDWDDAYIDPELEAELAEKSKMENKDMVTPTLEKQKAVLCVRTTYKLDELDALTLRKLSMLIRTSDAVLHYQIYRSASMSGLVTFKSEIKHYLYSSDKRDIMSEMIDANQFKNSLNDMKA